MPNCSSNSLLDDINKAKADMKAKLAEGTSAIKSGIGALASSVKGKLSALVPSAPSNSSFKDDLASLFGKTGAALEQAKYDLNQKWGSMVSDISKFTDAINPFGESSLNLCADVPNVEGSPNPDGSLTKVTKAQDSPAPAVAPAKPVALAPTVVDATKSTSSGVDLGGVSSSSLKSEWDTKINKPIFDILSNSSKPTSLTYLHKTNVDKLAKLVASSLGQSCIKKSRAPDDFAYPTTPWDSNAKPKNLTAQELEFVNNPDNKKTFLLTRIIPIWIDDMSKIFVINSTWAMIKAPFELNTDKPYKSDTAFNKTQETYFKNILRNARTISGDKYQLSANTVWDSTGQAYFDKCTAIVEANLTVAENYARLQTQTAK